MDDSRSCKSCAPSDGAPLSDALACIQAKTQGHALTERDMHCIIQAVVAETLSASDIAGFIAAGAEDHLTLQEVYYLTKAMVETGQQLSWPASLVVDKHCIGGIPGNRTTPIAVAIVAAYGLLIPKTSSRAITSPAGTADTMEVFTRVNLTISEIRKVVERENGCIVWGGAIALSPADERLIHVEKTAHLDSEGQMIASILSKKIAAGATHVVIDIPVGPTAKMRSMKRAEQFSRRLKRVADKFGLKTKVVLTEGAQPVGRGIGPALEARDVLEVLTRDPHAPKDLRAHALTIAGHLLEFSPQVAVGKGMAIAQDLLDNGKALAKFLAICEAQGGLREFPSAAFSQTIEAQQSGIITHINNYHIACVAKLAGAPETKAAGVVLLTPIHVRVEKGQPLFKIYANTRCELQKALDFIQQGHEIFSFSP